MKLKSPLILVILVVLSSSVFSQTLINAVALENGATILKSPRSRVDMTERVVLAKYSAGALLDQSPNVWSAGGTAFPKEFLIELTEEYNIQKLVFDNRCEYYQKIETKDVRVEFSTESRGSGFTLVGEFELARDSLHQIEIKSQKARWIKLIVLSNYGSQSQIQLAEFQALGVPGNKIGKTVNINGLWHTNWQDMTIEQNGSTFTGEYSYIQDRKKYKGKVLNGKINRNAITFIWDEKNSVGRATLYMNEEGNRISGLWRNEYQPKDFNLWTMTRERQEENAIEYSEVIEAENIEEETPTTPQVSKIGEKVVEEISEGETVVMENIVFMVGEITPHPDSYAELNVILQFMIENPKSKVKIVGHTDKVGNSQKNMLLSEARAEAIKEYLLEKGISKSRIKTEGQGDKQPTCPPPCDENRRVEFILLKKG
ncbi:MAG: OmpA family protein [Cyclobacteriaceae bacterium]